ncbi:MAG: alpha/beta hydrolase-fold protein [Streptosporangiaceae bacterium]
MLEPDSRLLTGLLVAGSAAWLVAGARLRPLAVKVACGGLAIVMAMTGGIALVNDYYGYYRTWPEFRADFGGGLGALGTDTAVTAAPAGSGTLTWVDLPGQRSGYHRRGLVYLPPQYHEPQYAHVRFPVLELFHGTPGSPRAWETLLRISQVADQLLARHLIGPMVLVMPAINGPGHDFQDCVDGPGVHDDTYLTTDVRADVRARYRVSADPYEWGLAGYSSGGYCAADLALRHRTLFGAAAVLEGYFRAADGPAGMALRDDKTLEDANSPLYLAEKLSPASGPVPAFWVAAGTLDGTDYATATAFVAALDRIEQVPFDREFDTAHTVSAWARVLPAALIWLWQQLAPPDLRVLFPVRAGAGHLASSRAVRARDTVRLERGPPGPGRCGFRPLLLKCAAAAGRPGVGVPPGFPAPRRPGAR